MNWSRKTLDEVADFRLGKMLDQQKNRGEFKPYLANINVRWGEFDLSDLREMRFEPREFDRYGLRYGDIVMCEGGEPGRCAVWKDQVPAMMIQKALHRIRPYACLDNQFLFYSFLKMGRNNELSGLFTGSTIKHLPREKLAKVPIDFPSLPIQRRIADILSVYDDLIENNRRRIDLLEEAARLLYREWFVHLRFPGHDHVRIVDGIPEGWESHRIVKLADVFRGKSYKSSELVDSSGQPFVNLKCIDRYGGFRVSGLKRFRGEHKDHHVTIPGDIVIAVTDMTRDAMIIAQAARVPLTVGDRAIYSMDLVKVVPRGGIEPEWFYGMLRFSRFSAVVREEATGATVLHLKPKHIENWETVVPATRLRGLFSEQFGAILQQIDNLELQNASCERVRDLLLPRLMNGEIAV